MRSSRRLASRKGRHTPALPWLLALTGCGSAYELQLFELLDSERALLVTSSGDTSSVEAYDAVGFVARRPPTGTIQIATLPSPPAELELAPRFTAGDPATDTPLSDLALRSFSASLDPDALGPWTEGAPDLAEFILPIPRPRCSNLSDDFVLTGIPFQIARIVSFATTLHDGSILVGGRDRVERILPDGTHHAVDTQGFSLDAATAREVDGRLAFTSGSQLVEGSLQGQALQLSVTNDWLTVTSTRSLWYVRTANAAYAMTHFGQVARVDTHPAELLYGFSAENPIKTRRGNLIVRADGSVVAAFGGAVEIITVRGSTVTHEIPDAPSSAANIAELAGGQLVIGDGFGEFWTRTDADWVHLDDRDIFAFAVDALETFRGGALIGTQKGYLGELSPGGVFCSRGRLLAGNIRFVRVAETGVFVVAQTSEVSAVEVAFLGFD
ncbi:MAG: hypothetical protein HY791_07620 [Deltaproteobacteria bacterium]|nr:hypothetical protein [Deltaproteobacteria bacterium]